MIRYIYHRGFIFLPTLMLAFFLLASSSPVFGESSQAQQLKSDCLRLKERFETLMKKNTDPRVVSCLSVETTALSWFLAATYLTDDTEKQKEMTQRASDFEKRWNQSKNWETRQLKALEFYYEGFKELIDVLASRDSRSFIRQELEEIAWQTDAQFAALESKIDADLEKCVILSGALGSMVAMAVRSIGGGSMDQPVQAILKDVVARAEYISQRSDAHYRAKLSLLYFGNVEGLTALIFLLGQNAGPPLSRELAQIHGSLNKHSYGQGLPESMSLTWVAQTQASLPLSYWLATH